MERRCRSELPERNGLERLDGVEPKYAGGRNIARYLKHSLQELLPDAFTASRNLPRDECERHTQGAPSLADPGPIALLGQEVQALDTAIKNAMG